MIILDTNVVSEVARAKPSRSVTNWLDRQPREDLHLCAPVLAEIHYGIQRLPASNKRMTLIAFLEKALRNAFAGRVLPFDEGAAEAYGLIVAQRELRGRPIGVMDAMVAAIARANGAKLATRNARLFDLLDIELLDPFDG